MLVLLNGPPASGKSTLATRWVATRPLALNLDIDVVRGLLGAWLDHPHDSGLAARSLAVAMATTHLGSGRDVIVPQFLARPEFIVELDDAARSAGAAFVEVALVVDRQVALDQFAARTATPENQAHVDAGALVADDPDAMADMYDRYMTMLAGRQNARRLDVIIDDIDATLAALERHTTAGPA